jgi:cytoskeleton protein RodZ
MTDDIDNSAEPGEEAAPPLAGERLAAARRELQIAILEIAKELHLDETKVRALERNEFDMLGAPVFAKGYLRKYAELVNVPSEEVVGDYYELTRSAEMPPVVASRARPRKELSPGPWIAVIVVMIVAATAYWWLTRPLDVQPATPAQVTTPAEPEETADRPAGAGMDTVDEAQPADDSTATGASIEPEPEPEPEPREEPASRQEPVPQARQPAVEETVSPAIAPGQMRLLLTYTGDCWTEVTDATGRRLFFALGTDGRTVELSGAEPFNVLLGSPLNVTLQVNGESFALPAAARPDQPLRLSVAGT